MSRCMVSSAILVLLLLLDVASAGNTTCASRQLDWYTDIVGENPCVTYQRLRQICNIDYQVPHMHGRPPGDQCDDPDSACCCNTISFTLSMLCLNCQHDRIEGSTAGVDAPPGTYGQYRAGCPNVPDHQLPAEVQTAACNRNIQLHDTLYNSWDDGAWFYVWTKDNTALIEAETNGTAFTHCSHGVPTASTIPSDTIASSTRSPATAISSSFFSVTSAIPTDGSTSNGTRIGSNAAPGRSTKPEGGAIAGIVIGILAVIVLFAFVLWFLRTQRRNARQSAEVFRWRKSIPTLTVATEAGIRSYNNQPVPPSPATTLPLPNPHSSREQRMMFSPELMVRERDRHATPPPYATREEGRRARTRDGGRGSASRYREDADSRVGSEPIDESPDPHMPLMPLRLEEKPPVPPKQ